MPENWITLTDADVLAANTVERVSLATIKKRDDLAEICAAVTGQIRQAYTFGSRELGPDGQIPEGLKGRAIAIALWRFVSEGVPKNEGLQTRDRKAAFDEATAYLASIAKAEVGMATDPSVATRHRRFRHRDEDGIL